MEGKKGFVLYTNKKFLLEALTNEQAGILFKHIYNYVNDKLDEAKEDAIDDPVIKMAWLSFKADLKEDLKKWKNICDRNQKNIQKRWQNQDTKNTSGKNGIPKIPSDTKNTDIDIDSVSDIDIDNNINVSKDTMAEVDKNLPAAIIELPCIKGYIHKVYEDDIKHYKELYPAVDVLQELKKMLGWIESNPKNRKTEAGIKSFITRWLSKCQDKAPKVETKNDASNNFGGFNVI